MLFVWTLLFALARAVQRLVEPLVLLAAFPFTITNRGTRASVAIDLSTPAAPDAYGVLVNAREAASDDGVFIIFFHGNATTAEETAAHIRARGVIAAPMLVLEYPGYGGVPGLASETAIDAIGDAAVGFLRTALGARRLLVVGQSVGSGPAAALAARHADVVIGCTLLSPYTSVRALAAHLTRPWIASAFVRPDLWNTADALAAFLARSALGRVRLVHGVLDGVIPVEHSRRLITALESPRVSSCFLEAAGHDVSLAHDNQDSVMSS